MAALLSCLRPIGTLIWQNTPLGTHIGYAMNYTEIINNLRNEMKQLQGAWQRMEAMVQRATRKGEIVRDDVLVWQVEAIRIQTEVNEFLESIVQGGNQGCFYFGGYCYPNVLRRYQLGKEAEKKKELVVEIKDIHNFDPVAIPPSPPEFGATSATDVFEDFESRMSVFEEIMEALKKDGISIIGVYGMGGVGKTQMVEEVGKQAKADMVFDEVVKAVATQTLDVRKIQGELADNLGIKLASETEVGRAGQLCERLKIGKILVIIDDVWKEINLNEIGIPCGDTMCKVVLTSREQGVFLDMNVQKDFHIGELLEHEAWALFKKKVGSHIEDSPEMCSVAQDVCRECGGLPIAILAVGGALRKYKHKHAWDDALEQLKNAELSKIKGVKERVVSSLMLSYDYLDPKDAQPCFLLCSLFPEDAEIPVEGLLRYGMGTEMVARVDTMEKTRNRVYTLVDTLKASCLLLEGKQRNFVKMHDVIRDVALSIASNSKQAFLVKTGLREWPSIGSRDCLAAISLSFNEHNINALPDDFECRNLTTLLLEFLWGFRYSIVSVQVPDKFFNGMGQLRVLELTNMSLLPHLPSSFHNLINLRMLCLDRCKLPDMSMLKELKKLEILSFEGSDIAALPPQIGHLTSLRLLDLRHHHCCRLIPLQVISGLSYLEVLYISDMNDYWDAAEGNDESRSNAFFVELNSLPHLIDLRIHIKNVVILPDDMKILFNKLIRFQISMESFPSYFDSLGILKRCGTRQLQLRNMPLKDGAKILSEKAEELLLCNVTGLKVLKGTDGFLDLKNLEIVGCNDVEHMFSKHNWVSQSHGQPASVPFCELTNLGISRCGLRYLFSPSFARCLEQLQSLLITDCYDFGKLIGNEGDGDKKEVTDLVIFPQLTNLTLRKLPNLVSVYPKLQHGCTSGGNSNPAEFLFNEKVAFPALGTLELWGLSEIREIWGNQLPVESFFKLSEIDIYSCHSLRDVFTSSRARSLIHLQKLSISSCENMKQIVGTEKREEESNDEIVFPQLKTVELSKLYSLRSFCSSRYEENDHDKALGTANQEINQPSLLPLFVDKVAFPALETLTILWLSKIREIWSNQLPVESFSKLSKIGIYECSLRDVFTSSRARSLVHLQELSIRSCENMKQIVGTEKREEESNDEIAFPQLETLELGNLCSLRSFCSSRYEENDHDKALGMANQEINQPSLPPLFDDKVAFPALETLELTNLSKIREIWGNQLPVESFSKLSEIKIYQCHSLRDVFTSSTVRSLVHLQKLSIYSCEYMKQIVGTEKMEEESNDEIVFPQLKTLELRNLCSLRSFCSSRYEENDHDKALGTANQEINQPSLPPLFDDKVAFPCLEQLEIWYMNLKELWPSGSLPNNSFCKLRNLVITDCMNLLNVDESKLVESFPTLQNCRIRNRGR